jgi:hypothetical protein
VSESETSMFHNAYYEALLEGRYQPRIDVEKTEDGTFTASYADVNGNTVTFTDVSQNEAFRRCNDLVIDGIREGKIHPFR